MQTQDLLDLLIASMYLHSLGIVDKPGVAFREQQSTFVHELHAHINSDFVIGAVNYLCSMP